MVDKEKIILEGKEGKGMSTCDYKGFVAHYILTMMNVEEENG